MSKVSNIPSEIRNFFSEKRRSIIMEAFGKLLESLQVDSRCLVFRSYWKDFLIISLFIAL